SDCASTAAGRDLTALAQIEVASGQLRYLEKPVHEVEGVVASPKGRWLAWLVNVEGKTEIKLRDLKSGQTISPSGLPLGVVTQMEFSQDDSSLALAFDGPRY